MHVVRSLKSDHSAASGGTSNFTVKIQVLALQTCIYVDEGFSKTVWQNSIRLKHNNYIEGVVDAPCSIFKI